MHICGYIVDAYISMYTLIIDICTYMQTKLNKSTYLTQKRLLSKEKST